MADESAVKVCVRVRPLIQREHSGSESTESVPVYWKADRQAIHQVDDGTIIKSLAYDRVFGAEESTSQLYQEIAKPLVVSTVKGYNGTIFAYGQTSSGKTFTMMGNSCAPGVIPMAMEDVFQTIKNCPEKEFLLRVSYMEIYNETVTDLLCDSWKRKPLEIREGNYKNVYVADLTEELVTSADQALAWLWKGEKNRHYGKTKMNQRSSRSHAIFRMILESRERSDLASGESVDSAIIVSHLNLVDLAGAERASQTGAEGARLKEGCNINRSLFTLGQVIKKLSEENQGGFTNYRDSKLTRILQNSLGGNAKTVIVCTVTPAAVDETLSTLQFASAAKRMKNDPHVTEVSDDGALLRRYRNEIVDLKRRLEEVSSVTRTAETEKEVLAQLLQEKDQLQREQQDRIRNLTNIIVTSSNFGATEKKMPKRRVTWGGKHLRGMHFESHIFREGEISFADKKRKVDLSALADRDDDGDEFCSRWEILEEPTFDADMNQSNITTRSFDDGDFMSPRMSELSEKVFRLEFQLKTEVQEKQDALETKAVLEKRMAELEVECQRQREALEKKVAELEAEALEKRGAELEAKVVEQKGVLESRVVELEAEAQEQKGAVDNRVAELEPDSLEQQGALENRVVKLKAEALEKRATELEAEALEQKTALEKRVAELEAEALEQNTALEKRVAELEAEGLQQKEELERRVAELQQQFKATAMHTPEDTQEQCKKDLEDTIQLCEKLVIEKETVEAERDLIKEKYSLLQEEKSVLQEAADAIKQENCTLKWEKDHLLKEVEEKKELVEFSALEQESTKQYESELKGEIARLQRAADHSVTRVRQLEADLAAMSAELIKKEECIAQLRDLNGKDLVQEIEQLTRSLDDAEAVSRDAKKDWAVLRSENLALRERDTELSDTFEKLQAEVQLLRDQQGADKIRFKKMQADLQWELQGAFEENTKLTALLDGKVPKNLTDNSQLQKQVAELKKELELSHERVVSLQEEVQELTALRDFPAKVDQLMRQICELTTELCSAQADKDSLEAAISAKQRELQSLEEAVRAAQEQQAYTQARLSEAESRAAELNQQHLEACGQIEALQSDTETWAMERQQLLSSINVLSHEVEQSNKREQILENKLAEQLQFVKDLEKELAEEQAARGEKDTLEERSGQLVDEIKKLAEELDNLQTERCKLKSNLQENMEKMVQQTEELEELRAERDQLKMDLQENVEMMIENQGELREAQGNIKEQQKTMQKLKNEIELMKSQLEETKDRCLPNTKDAEEEVHKVSRLQQNLREETDRLQIQIQQQAEELENLQVERAELQKNLQGHVEKCAQTQDQLRLIQEELEREQKVTSDLNVQNTERLSHLEKQICELTAELCSTQADKDRLEAAKSASEQELKRLEEEVREARGQLAHTQVRLSEAESRTAELSQQHLEARSQLEALLSDSESWAVEKEQLLSAVKELNHKVEQSNKQEQILEDKLAEQRQLVKDLEKELVEEQSARGEKENLEERSAQILDEVKKLGEELETLRAERAELQNSLQENVEKCAQTQAQLHSVQEELERQQKMNSDLTVQNAERVLQLEKKVCELTEELCSIQADKDGLEAVKSASEKELKRLEEEVREAQDQLAHTQARLSEAESRTAEFSQQHLEARSQLEVLQSDMESLDMERRQLLTSIKDLSHEVEQSNKREQVLENKWAEQQQLIKDLERELAEQSARGEKENLEERSSQLMDEIKKLGEELENLRAEKAELQKNLQENVEKCAQTQAQLHSVQEELEREQKVTSDLNVQNMERVSHLENQVKQISEELEEERKKGSQFSLQLGDTSAQLHSDLSQRKSVTEDSRHFLHQRLDETQQQLLGLFERIEKFRTRMLQTHQSLNTQLEELALVQNQLVFNVVRKMSMASRKLFISLGKSTDDIKLLLTTPVQVYAQLAVMHRKQFEAEAQHDLACVEEQRLQDLLLSWVETQGTLRCVTLPDFQDLWDQRAYELLEKREGYLQKLQGILGELEEAVAQNEVIVSKELLLEQKSNKELQVLCSTDVPDLDTLHRLLEQEGSRRITLVQQQKPLFLLLRDQYFEINKHLEDFKMEAQHLLKEERGRSLALLQAVNSSSTLMENTQLVIRLKQGEQQIKGLQAQVRELEESHRAMKVQESSQAKSGALLQNQLCEIKKDVVLKEKEIQDLQQQLAAEVKKGKVPSALELQELKNKLVKMEVERSFMTSCHQEEMAKMTVLLEHREEALRKLKETLRKVQNQDDMFSSMRGTTCSKASSNAGFSTAQVVQAKLESDVKRLENEVDELQRLVSSQKEEIRKWKDRALRLKNQRDVSNNQRLTSPQCTPSKRQQLVEPCNTPNRTAQTPVLPKQQDLASVEPEREALGPESDLGMGSSPSDAQSASCGAGTVENKKATEWWPMSADEIDNCKPQ